MAMVMTTAAKVTIQLTKMLEQARVNTRVVGFTGSQPNRPRTFNHETNTEEQVLVTIEFKGRNQSMRSVADQMGAIRDCAYSGNPDYAAVMHGIEEIATQPEQRKVVFFLTDTGSYDRTHMQHAQQFADRMGVVLIAIGIGSTVTTLFKHGADVNNIDDLGGSTFNALLRTLKAKD
jgi:cobalamin biosynthesis protein CobT